MKLSLRTPPTAVVVLTFVCFNGIVFVDHALAQTPQKANVTKPQTAGEYFKNVTTSSLKALSIGDFMATMGVISADLGLDCINCHPNAGTDKADWVFDTPRKKMTRRMIDMVDVINRTNFGGAQSITCFSCHHRSLRPITTIELDTLYGPPNEEKDAIVTTIPDTPPPDRILDKYLKALGGTQQLAGLKSFIATGASLGYSGIGGNGTFQILAQAPDRRTTLIEFKGHPERGDVMRAYNGQTGWVKAPRSVVSEYDLTGTELDGARLDAQLSFPGQIKQVLTNLRTGAPASINEQEVDVVQGTSSKGILVTLYFDQQSGLLVRYVRYGKSPIGRLPTQFDFDDYREVGGVKFPFKITFSWLDGKEAYQLNEVKTNVPLDAAKFNRP